jgi:Ca-activated chloride channel family protein
MKLILFISLISFSVSLHGQGNEYVAQANAYYKQGEFGLAENYYKRALEADPKNRIAKYNLANALQKQNKLNEAAQVLEELGAGTKDTLASAIWYNQGVAFSKLKNLEASIESYKKALRINPSDQDARENLEKALLEQKKQQQQQNKSKDSKMSQKEADQKLKLLQQKERELQQRQQNKNKKQGNGQAEDW